VTATALQRGGAVVLELPIPNEFKNKAVPYGAEFGTAVIRPSDGAQAHKQRQSDDASLGIAPWPDGFRYSKRHIVTIMSFAIAVRNRTESPDAPVINRTSPPTVRPSFLASRSVMTECKAPVSNRKSSVFPLMVTGTVNESRSCLTVTARVLPFI